MVLLRKVIGDALRARRLAQHRTLREVSTAANVSLGYLSEIERGHKEASSELLAAICEALGARLSEMLTDVSTTYELAEQMDEAFADSASESSFADSTGDRASAAPGRTGDGRGAEPRAAANVAVADGGVADGDVTDGDVTEGDVTVRVRSDGPLKTTLTARRATPGQRTSGQQRHDGPVLV